MCLSLGGKSVDKNLHKCPGVVGAMVAENNIHRCKNYNMVATKIYTTKIVLHPQVL